METVSNNSTFLTLLRKPKPELDLDEYYTRNCTPRKRKQDPDTPVKGKNCTSRKTNQRKQVQITPKRGKWTK